MEIIRNKVINNCVIIDGISRSGKFYLGKLVSGINGLEYFFNCSEVERIVALNRVGVLDFIDASALLGIAINESIYNMAIGRNLNARHDDGSSILNSFEKEDYLYRQNFGSDGEEAVGYLINNNRSSVMILHQSLHAIRLIMDVIPGSKFINIRRNPIDLAYSWIKRGWGRRYGKDSLSFEPVFQCDIGAVPYYAVDWADDYIKSNEYERVVKSIISLVEEEGNVVDSYQYNICDIYYEKLVDQPYNEINKICTYLERSMHKTMDDLIKRETRDSEFLTERSNKIDFIKYGMSDISVFEKLLEMGEQYDNRLIGGAL